MPKMPLPSTPDLSARKHAADTLAPGKALLAAGQYTAALKVFRAAAKADPHDIEAHRFVGLALNNLKRHEQALVAFATALALDDTRADLNNDYGFTLRMLDRYHEAITAYQKAIEIQPGYAEAHSNLGGALVIFSKFEVAAEHYRKALDLMRSLPVYAGGVHLPLFARAELGLATCLMQMGDNESAASLCRAALKRNEASLHLLDLLIMLPTTKPDAALLDRLDRVGHSIRKERDAAGMQHFHLVRAAAMDKLGRYKDAWDDIETARGKERQRKQRSYTSSAEKYSRILEAARSTPLEDGDAHSFAAAASGPVPLFIIGPSRSGKTTLEWLLSTQLSLVRGYEHDVVDDAIRRSRGENIAAPSRPLGTLNQSERAAFRENFQRLIIERAAGAQIVTSTLPKRIEDAILVARHIPNARFVFVTRDIDDLTLRIYMRNYQSDFDFVGSVATIKHYLGCFEEMSTVLQKRLGARAITVSYEDIVADPAAAISRVASLCGVSRRADAVPIPVVGDDRGCAAAYLDWLRTEASPR